MKLSQWLQSNAWFRSKRKLKSAFHAFGRMPSLLSIRSSIHLFNWTLINTSFWWTLCEWILHACTRHWQHHPTNLISPIARKSLNAPKLCNDYFSKIIKISNEIPALSLTQHRLGNVPSLLSLRQLDQLRQLALDRRVIKVKYSQRLLNIAFQTR